MPRYTYECSRCENTFEISHSIKEKLTDCNQCGQVGSLARVPGGFHFATSADGVNNTLPIGQIVRDHIQEAKEEIKREKEEMSQEYEP